MRRARGSNGDGAETGSDMVRFYLWRRETRHGRGRGHACKCTMAAFCLLPVTHWSAKGDITILVLGGWLDRVPWGCCSCCSMSEYIQPCAAGMGRSMAELG